MVKYGVISGPYFLVFRLNTEKISAFSPKTGKYRPEITPYLDTFHAVTSKLNFCYLKIIHILHPRYHPKLRGDIPKNKQKKKYVSCGYKINHNENEYWNEKQII